MLTLLQAVAFAVHLQDVDVMGESVKQGAELKGFPDGGGDFSPLWDLPPSLRYPLRDDCVLSRAFL
jgi:hypothetical protein